MIGDTLTTWHVPTRVHVGPGTGGVLAGEALTLGNCVLVVSDPGVVAAGHTGHVEELLRSGGLDVHRSDVVTTSPDVEVVRAVLAQLRTVGATLVVGVGGGSVMDVAKVTAIAATNPALLDDPRWDRSGVIELERTAVAPGLPLVQVPTTVSTGSEVNAVACINHRGSRRLVVGEPLFADLAIVDAELVASLPPELALFGAIETVGRVLCPYLEDNGDPVGDELAEGILRATVAAMTALTREPDDCEARRTLGWAATVSMTQLPNVGRNPWGHVLWYLQNTVGGRLGIAKGLAMAALLPRYLEDIATGSRLGPRCGRPPRLARIGHAVFATPPDDPLAGAHAITELLEAAGLPASLDGLREAGASVSVTAVSEFIDETERLWGSHGRLRGVTRSELEAFYTSALVPVASDGTSLTLT